MTGFGRTGDWFASLRAGVEPDLICLAKGLTGGFLPLAVTVVTDEIFDTFRSPTSEKTFWHGHSYTANPLGCAAALASLELLRENEPAFRTMEDHHRRFLTSLDHRGIERPRVMGTIVAFDLGGMGEDGYFNQIGRELRIQAMDMGLLLRPLGNTVYLMPPYSLTDEEREVMYSGVRELLGRRFNL